MLQLRRLLLATIILLISLSLPTAEVYAQSWMGYIEKDGFTLKKIVSDTVINTGQPFSYTIYFSIPPGATNVTITDILPSSLEYVSSSYLAPGTTPSVTVPSVGTMGPTYSLHWASVPLGCSGSFTITTRFPNGTTCDGTSAKNNVCVVGTSIPLTVTNACTPSVSTRAVASNPWHVSKQILNDVYVGGSCGNLTEDSVVTYKVCVYKDAGLTGQMNLVNGIVRDVLPSGASLQSSTCGATQSAQTITWNVGAMSATAMYNRVCCEFSVLYPRNLFPYGTSVTNRATLTGSLGSTARLCGDFIDSSQQTCIEFNTDDSLAINKKVYSNKQPGCAGKYEIKICNRGTTPIDAFTITDQLPSELGNFSIGATSAGLNVQLNGNNVTATSTSALMPGDCRKFFVHFIIPLNAVVGSQITNCADLIVPGWDTSTVCVSFKVAAPVPKLCLFKEVCGKLPSYSPGAIIRYRLRIQNIGGASVIGASITDALGTGLQYLGNPSYYSAAAWNAPCSNETTWQGVGVSHDPQTNTVTATLPTIEASCEEKIVTNCGYYGTSGIPFYFVEFDVKVPDTAALGQILNKFTVSGGNVTTTTSNTDILLIVGTAGFRLDKGVKRSLNAPYTTSVTAPPGSPVAYQCKLTVAPGSIALRHTTIVDLLPMNSSSTSDNFILGPCLPRGMTAEQSLALPFIANPSATAYKGVATGFADIDLLIPTGAPGPLFNGGCGTTATTWSAGLSGGETNLGFGFGPPPITQGNTATVEFKSVIDASAVSGQTACNTFAANACVRHIIGGSIITDQPIGQLESNTACIQIVKDTVETQPCATPPADMVGWWPLDETAFASGASVSDFTGTTNYVYMNTANNGEVVGTTATPVATGMVAGAIGLDGSSYVRVPDDPSLDFGTRNFTLDAWVYPTDGENVHSIVEKRQQVDNGVTGYALYTVLGRVGFQLATTMWQHFHTNITLPLNTWSFVSVRVDRVNSRVTIDVNGGGGTNTQTFVISTGIVNIDNSAPLLIGGHPFLSTSLLHWNGRLDEIEIFDRLLSSSELLAIYNARAKGKCKDLSACELNVTQSDPSCCTSTFTVPASSAGVTSVEYQLGGYATLHVANSSSMYTTPCTPTSSVIGSTSGTLSYATPCTSTLNINVHVRTLLGTGTITFTIRYSNGTHCTFTRQVACDRIETINPNRVVPNVWPTNSGHVGNGNGTQSRRITITNTKTPPSPISHVLLDFGDTLPFVVKDVSVNGGQWRYDRWGEKSERLPSGRWGESFCGEFPEPTHTLQFTLEGNENIEGNLKISVYHCDGDVVELDPIAFRTNQPILEKEYKLVRAQSTPDKEQTLCVAELEFDTAAMSKIDDEFMPDVKFMTIEIDRDSCVPPIPDCPFNTMVGVTAGWSTDNGDDERAGVSADKMPGNVASTSISRSSAVVTFLQALGIRDSARWPRNVRVFYTALHKGTMPQNLKIRLRTTFHDEDGNAFSKDTIETDMKIVGVEEPTTGDKPKQRISLVVSPNPTAQQAVISYELSTQQDVTLELCDLNGRTIMQLEQGWRSSGQHSVHMNTTDIASGSYLVRLRTTQEIITYHVSIVH